MAVIVCGLFTIFLLAQMANYESLEVVRALTSTDVNRLPAAQVKCALKTLLAGQHQADEPTNSELLGELRSIREDLAAIKEIKEEIKSLHIRLDDAYRIINQQNYFLESLDAKERVRNLVVTGVKEEADSLGRTDEEKVKSIIEAAGYTDTINPETWTVRRLGQPDDRRKRTLHVQVENQGQRNAILRMAMARNLKEKGDKFTRVFIKKDIHPASRREMMRLKNRQREEKEKPDNQGVQIEYDWHDRVLLRDGVVINKYFPNFAMVGRTGRQN